MGQSPLYMKWGPTGWRRFVRKPGTEQVVEQPLLYMIMGPNGAGKTTAAMNLLPMLGINEFINVDEIARGLNPLNPSAQDLVAARLTLKRIDEMIEMRKSFALETTGASHFFKKLDRAKELGFKLGLIYLWLPLVEFAKFRVKMRVAQGGHDIPEEVIERRYKRGLYNLWNHYLPLADEASIFDTTLPNVHLIAERRDGPWQTYRPDVWKAIERKVEEVSNAR